MSDLAGDIQVVAIVLDKLSCDGERVVLRVSGIDGNLGGLDLGDDMEGCIISTDAEGDRELTAAKAALQEAMRVGPSSVYQVGPSSTAPFK